MSPHLTETLRKLKLFNQKQALKSRKPFSTLVFAGSNGGMLSRDNLRYGLNVCLDNTGLRRIRVHDLRHTYATIRLLKGHNIGDVSYQLGHSSISITYDVYGHWVPGKFKSEVDELDRRMGL
jgi:integrase